MEKKSGGVVLGRTGKLFFRDLDFSCVWFSNFFLLCLFNRCGFTRVDFLILFLKFFCSLLSLFTAWSNTTPSLAGCSILWKPPIHLHRPFRLVGRWRRFGRRGDCWVFLFCLVFFFPGICHINSLFASTPYLLCGHLLRGPMGEEAFSC